MKIRIFIFLLLAAFCLPELVTAANPDSLKHYQLEGRRGIRNSNLREAEAGFSKVLELEPENFEALLNLGVAYSGTGRNERALGMFLRAYQIDSSNADLLNNLGTVNSNLGEHGTAVQYFERAVKADTTSGLYQTNLGQELLRVGRIDESLSLLQKIAEKGPNAIVLYSIGNAFSVKKAFDSAEVYYDRALKSGGRSAELHYFLGLSQRNQGKLGSADSSFKAALEIKPDYLECLQATGMMYMMVGQYGDAAGYFGRAVAVDSSYHPAWISLGASTALSGAYQRADSILQHLYAVDSSLAFQMLDVIDHETARWKDQEK